MEIKISTRQPPELSASDFDLSDAAPNPARARWVRRQMDARLLESMQYLLRVASKGLQVDVSGYSTDLARLAAEPVRIAPKDTHFIRLFIAV